MQRKDRVEGALAPVPVLLPGPQPHTSTGQPLSKSELSGKDQGPQMTHRLRPLCSMGESRALVPLAPHSARYCPEVGLLLPPYPCHL